MGQFFRGDPLDVDGTYEGSATFSVPPNPGIYYFVVTTDAAFRLTEGSELNNTYVDPVAIEVSPSYRAEVSTTVDAIANGSPIPLTGFAYDVGTNEKVGSVPVSIRVLVKGTRRVLRVVTDANGDFQSSFNPLPNEGGHYRIGADHPGIQADHVQDEFDVYSMRFDSNGLSFNTFPGTAVQGTVLLKNLSELPISGLTLESEVDPENFTLTLDGPDSLEPGGAAQISYSFLPGSVPRPYQFRSRIKAQTDQGVQIYLPYTLNISPRTPTLVANPGFLRTGMTRGNQSFVQFQLSNVGGAPTGDLQVLLPSIPWLKLVSPENVPSLAPGESTEVMLSLLPDLSLPLGQYDGSLVIQSAIASSNVDFQFRAISDALGDLQVDVSDDFTYYVEGSPKVEGATVTLTDRISGDRVATGMTDANGVILLTDIQEGTYQMDVSAPKHATYRSPVNIVRRLLLENNTYIDRQTVTYKWTVVPTQIVDKYRIVLESEFEAEVPIPVVTIDNPLLMPIVVRGEDTQINISVTNH